MMLLDYVDIVLEPQKAAEMLSKSADRIYVRSIANQKQNGSEDRSYK